MTRLARHVRRTADGRPGSGRGRVATRAPRAVHRSLPGATDSRVIRDGPETKPCGPRRERVAATGWTDASRAGARARRGEPLEDASGGRARCRISDLDTSTTQRPWCGAGRPDPKRRRDGVARVFVPAGAWYQAWWGATRIGLPAVGAAGGTGWYSKAVPGPQHRALPGTTTRWNRCGMVVTSRPSATSAPAAVPSAAR